VLARVPARRAGPLSVVRAVLPALLVASCGACTKTSPQMAPGQASAAPGKPAEKGDTAEDTTPPPGVDVTKLDDFERKVFFRILNKESSACGKAHSLIHSVKHDRDCRKSLYAARYVARLVDSGYTDSEIGELLEKRFRGGAPKRIDVSEAPVKGNPNAPVTIVEFVDYECPHCKRVQPVLRQVLEEFKDDVKIVFKHYPLSTHTNARTAAEAAVAAHKQGKFWAYNDRLWNIADGLTPAAMEQQAKEVGLDVAKWRSDMESEAVKTRVQKDRDEGSALGIMATPTLYINGRHFTDQKEMDSLKDWIQEELGR
jgi:protein-disulfide isomerase